jgi:peptidoglycan hydrolase-like protein with peptidoglycan-binding domain
MSRTGRRSIVAVALAAVVSAAGATAFGIGVRSGDPPRREVPPPATAEVVRETLIDYEEVAGELGYGEAVPLHYVGPPAAGVDEDPPNATPPPSSPPPDPGLGLVTWLPPVDSVVARGEPLFRVDNQPVVLLLGDLPLYRTLSTGVDGPDVQQLEENLSALGYTGFTVDGSFTGYTADAVRRWQRALGVSETGTVAPGALVYAGGEVRIDAHTLRVGDAAGGAASGAASGEILTYTGTVPKVTAALPVSRQRYAAQGTEVSVALPDGGTATGTVERTDEAAEAGDAELALPGGEPMLTVTIAFPDRDELGEQTAGTVQVRFIAQQREDVLTVPVVALVALIEGGYGVQVVDGSTTRYVAVETGMFARGRVEITSGDLAPGMAVVVPR